ncbi:MAG: SMC family ATPase [Chloroflexi bacterium]|nr:SMC family ATPase [Chloroflexota bacterium]
MCYRGDENELDFSGIHLACLAGENGHGKSALLDAMTWALWGKSRARRDDELITQGETEMEVQLDFQLGDNTYRVVRKRSRQGQGRSALDLQLQKDDVFIPLTSDTLRATQREIIALLRMDYETFINSAFLLQGRADEFTTKPAGERKHILGEILGLGFYEKCEEQAKKLARECAAEVQELSGALQQMKQEMEKEPLYVAEAAEAEEAEQTLRQKLEPAEETLQALRENRRELQSKKRLLADSRGRLAQITRERDTLAKQQHQAETRLATSQAVLGRRQEILEGYQALADARAKIAGYADLLDRLVTLSEEKKKQEQQLAAAQHKLETERQVLQSRIDQLEKQIARRPQAEAALREAETKLAVLAEKQESLAAKRATISQKTEEIAHLSATNRQLKEEMEELRQKLDTLDTAEAECPLCGQPLTSEHAGDIRSQYEAAGKAKGDTWRANQSQVQEIQALVKAEQNAIRQIERELRAQTTWQRKRAQAEQATSEAHEAAQELATVRAAQQETQERLAAGTFAEEARIKLAKLDREIAALGYSSDAHTQARTRAAELAPYEDAFRELQVAQDQLEATRKQLAQLQESLAQREERLEQEGAQVSALEANIAELETLVENLPAQQSLVSELQQQLAQARMRLGAARQRLDYCHSQASAYKKQKVILDQRSHEKTIYEELQLAFGARGLRAMIIESALPEIEEEANHILTRMTGGRMSVRFETQRETQKKTIVETLDIHISDELGTRNYQLYSGGEAFRINFAIRVALSKLLARRAGARLQTLVIDEGFGTQDTQGRERLVEAINAIRSDFERVLVITHIDELKDLFPVRIDVLKTPAGSRLQVN